MPGRSVDYLPNPGPGRDTICTDEMIDRLVDLLRNATPIQIAAPMCGVNVGTVHRWLAKPSNEAQERFKDKAHAAIAEGRQRLLQGIVGASMAGEWKAAAWLLERADPQTFGPPPARTEIGPPGAFDRSASDAEVEAQLAEAQAILALPEVNDAEG